MAGLTFLAGHARYQASEVEPSTSTMRAMAEAARLADGAQRLVQEREPAAALASFRRAHELSSDPTLLLDIGRLERQLGNQARAAHAFEEFLERGSERVAPERVLLTRRQLRDAMVGVARLNLQTNVQGATVELVEAERGVATSSGFAVNVLVDAGERSLIVSKAGYDSRALVIQVGPGEVRSLRVDLEKAAGRSETSPNKPRWASLR